MKALTRDEATQVYRTRYWNVCRCDDWPPALAVALFDGAVQHGATQAIRLMQDALGVVRDGVIGPKTLAAAHALSAGDVLVRFLAYRQALYHALPHGAVYGLGWSRRLFACMRCIYSELPGGTP